MIKQFHMCGNGMIVSNPLSIKTAMVRQRQIAFRAQEQKKDFPYVFFVTLTYSNEHLPYKLKLDNEDTNKFIKRFKITLKRKYNYDAKKENFAYLKASEYGEVFGRPHHHFGLYFKLPISLRAVESAVKDCWSFGRVQTEIEKGSGHYLCKYLSKFNESSGLLKKTDEKVRWSQGFGSGYIERNKDWHLQGVVMEHICNLSDIDNVSIDCGIYHKWCKNIDNYGCSPTLDESMAELYDNGILVNKLAPSGYALDDVEIWLPRYTRNTVHVIDSNADYFIPMPKYYKDKIFPKICSDFNLCKDVLHYPKLLQLNKIYSEQYNLELSDNGLVSIDDMNALASRDYDNALKKARDAKNKRMAKKRQNRYILNKLQEIDFTE